MNNKYKIDLNLNGALSETITGFIESNIDLHLLEDKYIFIVKKTSDLFYEYYDGCEDVYDEDAAPKKPCEEALKAVDKKGTTICWVIYFSSFKEWIEFIRKNGTCVVSGNPLTIEIYDDYRE